MLCDDGFAVGISSSLCAISAAGALIVAHQLLAYLRGNGDGDSSITAARGTLPMQQDVMIVSLPVFPVINTTLKETLLPSDDAFVLALAASEIWWQISYWQRITLCRVAWISPQDRQNEVAWIALSQQAEVVMQRHWVRLAREEEMINDLQWSDTDRALVASLPKPWQYPLNRLFAVMTAVAVMATLLWRIVPVYYKKIFCIWYLFSFIAVGLFFGMIVLACLFVFANWIYTKLRRWARIAR